MTSWSSLIRPQMALTISPTLGYHRDRAAAVVEGAHHRLGLAAMLIVGLLLSLGGVGLLCWLIFTLTVYALPFFVGLTLGMAAYHSGAGVPGALILGFLAGALTLALARFMFALSRPIALRVVIGALFAVPAGVAGYNTVLGLSQFGGASLVWRETFAWVGALIVGGVALVRLAASDRLSNHRDEVVALTPRAVLMIGRRRR